MFRFDFAQQIGFSVMLMLNRCVLLYIEQVIIQCLYMHIETIQFLIVFLLLLFITYICILIIHCNFMSSILSFDIFSHILAKEIIEIHHRIFYARSDKLPEGSFSLSPQSAYYNFPLKNMKMENHKITYYEDRKCFWVQCHLKKFSMVFLFIFE